MVRRRQLQREHLHLLRTHALICILREEFEFEDEIEIENEFKDELESLRLRTGEARASSVLAFLGRQWDVRILGENTLLTMTPESNSAQVSPCHCGSRRLINFNPVDIELRNRMHGC